MFDASAIARHDPPVLATSTDGVGTKVAIAQALDKHDTIGFDLVGMVVDDIVVCGAEPLFMTDYIATGKVVPERIAAIVSGIAEACARGRRRPRRRRDRGAPGPARARTSTTSPAPRPASSSMPTSSARIGSRAGDVVVALASQRPALQRLLPRPPRHRVAPAGRSTATSTSSAGRSARSCSSRPASTPPLLDLIRPTASTCTPSATSPAAGSPPTSRGCCPGTAAPARPLHLDAAAGLRDDPGPRPRARGPTSSAPSTRASASSRCCPADRPTAPSSCGERAAYRPGSSAR